MVYPCNECGRMPRLCDCEPAPSKWVQLQWQTRRVTIDAAYWYLGFIALWGLAAAVWDVSPPGTAWLVFAGMEFEYLGVVFASRRWARKRGGLDHG